MDPFCIQILSVFMADNFAFYLRFTPAICASALFNFVFPNLVKRFNSEETVRTSLFESV